MNQVRELLAKFNSRFHSKAKVYRAPGRVNLIGEHTDYNEGFVLPAAIGLSCWVAIASRDDRKLVLYSGIVENLSRQISTISSHMPPATGQIIPWESHGLWNRQGTPVVARIFIYPAMCLWVRA